MKKLSRLTMVSLLCAVLLISLLAGCQSQSGQASSGSQATSQQAGSTQKTTVTVWAFGEEGNSLSQMKGAFEAENEDLQLEILSIPWDVADEKLTAAFAGKTGPDVVQMQNHTLLDYASAGTLYSMDELVGDYPELSLDNFYDFGKECVTYEGSQIGVPWYVEATVLFYRTDIFEELQLSPPKTWDDLKETARALGARGDDMYGLGIGAANPVPGWAFVMQNEGNFVVDGTPTANSPEFIEALAFYQSFFTEGLVPNADTDLMQAFIDGSCPMTLQEPWVLNFLDGNTEMDGKWATATLPAGKNSMSYVGGSALVISKFAKDVDAAARFVAFMSRPENQVAWYEISKTLPSTPKAWEAEALAGNDKLVAFGQQLYDGRTAPMINNFMGMVVELSKAMERINIGGEDPAVVCEDLNKAVGNLLNG